MAATIGDFMKPEFREAPEDASEIAFRPRPEWTIPSGVVQGGVVAVMLDMAMAVAGKGAISTATLQLDILRPVVGETLVARGRLTRKGRRIVFAEAELRDENDVLLARGTQTAVPLG